MPGGDVVVGIVAHHLVTDDRSMSLWLGELAGEPAPPLEIQYTDFAVWQHSWLNQPDQAWLADYWREALRGLPGRCAPPPDRAADGVPVTAVYRTPLDPARLSIVDSRAHALGATRLAAWAAVVGLAVSRRIGCERVVVGLFTEGRPLPELTSLIGCFANIVALPVDLRGRPGFDALVARCRDGLIEAVRRQDLPFRTSTTSPRTAAPGWSVHPAPGCRCPGRTPDRVHRCRLTRIPPRSPGPGCSAPPR
jgi:hypothetical protein